jgi:hypothetical protein
LGILSGIFVNNVLPAFAVMAIGLYLDRGLHVDKKTLSRMAVYVLTPALAFSSIVKSEVSPGDFGLMLVYVLVITGAMCALGLLVGRLLRWPRRSVDALVLSIAFLNSGNFGLSVVLFSYGQVGLELGTIFFVGTNLAANTLAAFFASRGNGTTRQALLNILKLPAPYAFVLALLLRSLQVELPLVVMRPISLVAQATVPIMLLMLGVQLSQTRIRSRLREVSVAVGLRLVAGAALGAVLAPVIGLQGLARQVGIVQAAMPTAVSSGLIAIEFDADAELVSSAIFVSTLLSSVTLTLVIALLG